MKNNELNWDSAKAWQDKANAKKEEFSEPLWSWDCNFKLDFDGPLVSVSSRFYPPHKNAGDWWEGTLTVYLLNKKLFEEEFKENTLEQLRKSVEKFSEKYAKSITL